MLSIFRRADRGWRRRGSSAIADGHGRGLGRGRILAVKWGYNPNSSSLGVDVTFLLFGMLAVTLLTPLVGMVLRARGWLGAATQQGDTDGAPDRSGDPAREGDVTG